MTEEDIYTHLKAAFQGCDVDRIREDEADTVAGEYTYGIDVPTGQRLILSVEVIG
jgi:hypothetical protein